MFYLIGKKTSASLGSDLCLPFGNLNSFFASGDFCYLQIIFANSLDPDKDRQNVGLIWIQAIRHSDSVPDFFLYFEKVNFEKSQQTTTNT